MDKIIDKAQNVLDMSNYQPETGYAAIGQVEAYWEALRAGRLLPKRSDIDPRGIELALEYAFIVERIAPGIARLRIAGSHLNDLLGMEVRGMPLTTFFTPSARTDISDLLEVVFQTPAKATLRLCSEAVAARPKMEARMILLPLKSDLGDVSRVLGCFVSKGDMGLAPRRFEIMTKEVNHVVEGPTTFPNPTQIGKPAVPPFPMFERPAPAGLSESGEKFGRKQEKPHPPYLRLVKSDE